MSDYKVGVSKLDDMYIDLDDGNGAVQVDAVYIGTALIWPLEGGDTNGRAILESNSTISIESTVIFTASASLTSTTDLNADASVNDEVLGACVIESTSSLEASATQFEMYVTSTSEPTISSPSTMNISEVSPDYWHVYSTDVVTYFRFDYFDTLMRTDVTEVEVNIGDTITTLYQTFYLLEAMTDFTWNGPCNATDMTNTFTSCDVLENISVFDTSNVTIFENAFSYCRALTDMPDLDYSSALSLNHAWTQCSAMIHFPAISAPVCTDFSYGWSACNLMESIGVITGSAGTNFLGTFAYCGELKCIGGIDTTNQTTTSNMLLNCASLVAPNASEQALLLAGDAYTNTNPCPENGPIPPIYLMTEALEDDGVFQYLFNSSASGAIYNGRLEHSALSNDEVEGTPWWPSNAHYPDDTLPAGGWIDLNANGNATRQINTQWTPPSDQEWTISAIYNVNLGVSYDMFVLHYDGAGSVDIYLGSESDDIPALPTYAGIPYTPPTTPWIILETPPDIINVDVDNIIYNMDSFTTI